MKNTTKNRLDRIVEYIVNFYQTHHYSSTTWNFFIEKGTEVIEGKRTLSSFRKLKVPEPDELQVNYNDKFHIMRRT